MRLKPMLQWGDQCAQDPPRESPIRGGTSLPLPAEGRLAPFTTGVSAIGAYQMVGNMHEWVADCGHASYDDDPPVDGSAWGDSCVDGGLWTLRGPSWVTPLGAGRSAWRQLANPGQTFAHQGIRCARDPLEPE